MIGVAGTQPRSRTSYAGLRNREVI